MDKAVITRSLLSYSDDPGKFIAEFVEKVESLKTTFPDVKIELIRYAVLHRPRNPISYIQEHPKDENIEQIEDDNFLIEDLDKE